jgi:hypothetical protein
MRWSASQALAWIIRRKALSLEKREWTPDMGPELEAAQRKLAELIGSGQVQAWGRSQPHSMVDRMPSDPFRIPGLTVVVGPHGDMKTLPPHLPPDKRYQGDVWHAIEFEADEIKQAYPRPPPIPAAEWMRKNAEDHAATGTIGKRDVMVRDCMSATGCKKREAEAAHKNLPESLKRPRGKTRKSLG